MWYDILQSNIVAGLVVAVLLLTVAYLWTDGRNLPPGPRPWPVVGNLPSLSGDVEKAVESLRRRYGNVFRLYMGSQLTVFVNGYEAIKDVLLTRGEEFADRPSLFMSEQISKGKGLALTSGELWKQQRRFALHTLRDFGLGKSSVESKILEEAETLIKRLEDTEGGQFIINKQFHTSVSNVICSIVFGIRFDEEDPEFKKYVNAMEETISSIGVGALNFMPWLKYLPGDLFNYHSILRHVDYVENFINEQIREHKNTLDPDNPRDFIDAYLVEMSAHVDDPNSFFEGEQLVTAIGDLFAAGTETTSTTLRWAMLYLINYPDVQAKLRTEIHSVVGKSRLPSVKDRKFMPFTEAVIMEIQRCGDISFMGVPHAPIRDTTLNGYTIPKGTAIIPSMVSIHKDPEIWPNPEQFNPDRFLDSDGHVVRSEYLMPFGAGKRVCLGESLARMEIFLFLVAILQRFKVKPPEGVTSLPDSPILGLARSPRCFPLRLELDI